MDLTRLPLLSRPILGRTLLGLLCLLGVLCLLRTSAQIGSSASRVNSKTTAAQTSRSTQKNSRDLPTLDHPLERAFVNGSLETTAQSMQFPANVCEMPEFQSSSLRLNITIFVFAWRRMASLKRTIESLQRAQYCARYVPLRIYIDGGAWPEVVRYVHNVEWVHGNKSVVSYHEQGRSLGIRGMWIQAAQNPQPDQHVLPLEDDIELSPLYYWWLLRAARAYGSFDDAQRMRQRRLVGVSLYTPRLNEIRYPQSKWLPDRVTTSPVFLLQVPCSWGALFFGSAWAEFLHFYEQRVQDPFFNFSQEVEQRGVGKDREPLGDPHLFLPGSRSNVWPRSWKRFMIDFMYGRGYVMLYPSLHRQRAFSTTYMERGGHSAKDGKEEAIQIGSLRRDVDPLKTVGLQSVTDLPTVAQRMLELPPYDALPTFDVYHQRRPLDELVSRGLAFTERVRWWGRFRAKVEAKPELVSKYASLAAEWSGVRLAAESTGGGCAIDTLIRVPPRPASSPPTGSSLNFTSDAAPSPPALSERYLVYQPPGGIGEWYIALRNAAGIARALGRTLVVPHLMWGRSSLPIDFSVVFDIEPLQRVLPAVIEMNAFLKLGLRPSRLVLIHAKDPHVIPARTYFDKVAMWADVDSVSMSAQNGFAADYVRLYSGCDDQVLAFSQLYAAFDGFETAAEQEWLDWTLFPALFNDKPHVSRKAQQLLSEAKWGGGNRGSFTCVHLADIDQATLSSKSHGAFGADPAQYESADFDIAMPAASSRRSHASGCEAYDAEALLPSGRRWVRELLDQGAACAIGDEVVPLNLKHLPPRNNVFVLGDGGRALSRPLAQQMGAWLGASFSNISDLVAAAGIQLATVEWPALEMHVCASAQTLLINRYSPLSAVLLRRATFISRQLAVKPPLEISWHRLDSHSCLPLFTKTARFDVVPNRFGILGQFGPNRRLQLLTTNVSALIGQNGRIFQNASIELEVFVSNVSHPLSLFEYTKENNHRGVTLPVQPPAGGWRDMHWQTVVLPISRSHYSFPMSTPWDNMDRLELYYGNPDPSQPKSDFIRIRNVFLRSTRSYYTNQGDSPSNYLMCRDLERLSRHPSTGGAASTTTASSTTLPLQGANTMNSTWQAQLVNEEANLKRMMMDEMGELSMNNDLINDLKGDRDLGNPEVVVEKPRARRWVIFAVAAALLILVTAIVLVLKRRGTIISAMLKRGQRQN